VGRRRKSTEPGQNRSVNVLRRISLKRLLLLCGVVVAVGVAGTALASALGAGPRPEAEPLAKAVHDALAAPAPEGVSANIQLTNQLLEGASLAGAAGGGGGGSSLTSGPLFNGGSGRLWASKDGRFRLELQDESGDTQILYDGHTFKIYDAASNTLYRYDPPAEASSTESPPADQHEVPSLAKIEEAISHISEHASLSGAQPSDVAGAPAYTVRIAPKEGGSLFAGAELSFNADNGTPLRAALYSTSSPDPVLELAATEISYGAVPDSVFEISPPADVKVEEIIERHVSAQPGTGTGTGTAPDTSTGTEAKPTVTTHGSGPGTIVVLETKTQGSTQSHPLEGLPQVKINGTSASELRTALGTVLSFERSGVRYLVAGSVKPAQLEAVAREL
jgi:outer membrane lipoprotein-sorting protein